jgi:hypothetical protein
LIRVAKFEMIIIISTTLQSLQNTLRPMLFDYIRKISMLKKLKPPQMHTTVLDKALALA